MPERAWNRRKIDGIPVGKTIRVTMNVSSDDPVRAKLIALIAPLALGAYQHESELAELSQEELYYLLVDVARLADAVTALEETLIVRHREAGASWAELGAALDIDRQSARGRYQRISSAHARGLTQRGADAEDAGEGLVTIVSGDASVGTVIGQQTNHHHN